MLKSPELGDSQRIFQLLLHKILLMLCIIEINSIFPNVEAHHELPNYKEREHNASYHYYDDLFLRIPLIFENINSACRECKCSVRHGVDQERKDQQL